MTRFVLGVFSKNNLQINRESTILLFNYLCESEGNNMRVDVIVPNFDEGAEEVTLSSWYKKEGDKIFKNDIIADAETNSVACGITSSYDCVLVQILVQEGEVISQGTKIAVIDTDINAEISTAQDTEDIKSESKFIDAQLAKRKRDSDNQQGSSNDGGYMLSIPINNQNNSADDSSIISLAEQTALSEEVSKKPKNSCSSRTETKVISILKKAESDAQEEAEKIRNTILEDATKAAYTEGEVLKAKILKDYEEKAAKDANDMHNKIIQGSLIEANATKAKIVDDAKIMAEEEAKKIRESILEDAKINAHIKAEAVSTDIIKKAEEEAKKEATMKAKDIIESTINEAKYQAREIKKDIIHSASKHAEKESKEIVKEVIKKARNQSKFCAEELINETTKLASNEAEKLKNGILESAHKEIKASVKAALNVVLKQVNKDIQQTARTEMSKIKECASKTETSTVQKLLNIGDDGAPEMYADNWNKPQYFASVGDKNEQVDFLRQRISEKMKDTYDTSVISTVSSEIDMSAILSLEQVFGKAFEAKHNTRLGFTPFFIMACIAALKHYKVFNAHIRGQEIIYKNDYDISVITCGNDGVAAPVIRHADKMTIAEIERTMIALSRRAVEGTLSVEEVSGGTFTVVNAGIYGSLIGTDLLTPPQVATLSVHKMHNRPIATDNGVEIRPMLYISLSYDHVVADTKQASEFISCVKNYVENPGWQILGL